MDVGCLGELELPLVCDIMSVQQQEQARSRDLVIHDFVSCAVEGDLLKVRFIGLLVKGVYITQCIGAC